MKEKVLCIIFVSFLAVAGLLVDSTISLAYTTITQDTLPFDILDLNIKNYTKLAEEDIEALIGCDVDNWPRQIDITDEDNPTIDASASFIFFKSSIHSYFADLSEYHNDLEIEELERVIGKDISNYTTPEPSDMILLGLLLLSFVVIQRKKVFK